MASPDGGDSSEATRKSLFELSNVLNRKRGEEGQSDRDKNLTRFVSTTPRVRTNNPRGGAWNPSLCWDLREEPISVRQLTFFPFLFFRNTELLHG